jgi:hypothetical protein
MARLCKACRLPVDDPRDHDCPDDDDPGAAQGQDGDGEEAA